MIENKRVAGAILAAVAALTAVVVGLLVWLSPSAPADQTRGGQTEKVAPADRSNPVPDDPRTAAPADRAGPPPPDDSAEFAPADRAGNPPPPDDSAAAAHE